MADFSKLSDEELVALHKKAKSAKDMSDEELVAAYNANKQPDREPDDNFRSSTFAHFRDAVESGATYGFDDEIRGGMMAPIEATKNWIQGKGFDLGEAYRTMRDKERNYKNYREEVSPVASTTGELLGGITTAGGMVKKGLTLGSTKFLPMAAEAAAHGLVQGAGDAEENVAGDALRGGIVSGVTGGLLGKFGNKIIDKFSKKPNLMTVKQMEDAGGAIFDQMRATGTVINRRSGNRLINNLKLVAGNKNIELAPRTAGMVREIDNVLGDGPIHFKNLHEYRETLNHAISKNTNPADVKRLTKMKKVLDDFRAGLEPQHLNRGTPEATALLDQANEFWTRKHSLDIIDNIMDQVDINSGSATVGGIARAAVTEFKKLYKNKKMLARYSKEQQALIRQIAAGGSTSRVVNWLAKFAPNSIISAVLSSGIGAQMMGPAGYVVFPSTGYAASKLTDRAASKAINSLRTSVASNLPPAIPTNKVPHLYNMVGVQTGSEFNRRNK